MKIKTPKHIQQQGFSLLEMLLASSIMMVVVGGSMSLQSNLFKVTTQNNERAFASEKAAQMFEELRAFVQANRETDISKLQNFSDGSSYNFILTTEKKEITTGTGQASIDLNNPADALSGNKIRNDSWRYVRQVQIKPVPNDENARFVSVSVAYGNGNSTEPGPAGPPLATIAGILKTNISADPPTQVYDLYMIASENSPSWWADMANLRPSFERTLLDLEQRNPGLTFRRHFINKSAFGRDPYYMPYINTASNANSQALPWTFFYPGKINASVGENYVKNNFNARLRTDTAAEFNHIDRSHPNYDPSIGLNYKHYALADQYNHALRFPEQMAMEKRLMNADPGTFRENISLVTFLHRLNEGMLKNALVVNMHGELLPFPALRNFSDPAKSPDQFAIRLDSPPNTDPATTALPTAATTGSPPVANSNNNYISLAYKRLVSHPENLKYDNGARVAWRVYAYEEIPPNVNGLSGTLTQTQREQSTVPVSSLFIPTIGNGPHYDNADLPGYINYPDFTPADPSTWAANTLQIDKLVGSDNQDYAWKGIANTTDTHRFFDSAGGVNSKAKFVNPLGITQLLRATASSPIASTVAPTSNQIRFASSFYGSTTAAANALNNQLIVLSAGTNNEEIVRVVSADISSGQLRLNLNRNLANDHRATTPNIGGGLTFTAIGVLPAPITLHKDYDVEVVNTTMYGAPHRGILVRLYDTPTRAPLNTTTNRGLAENRRLEALEYIPGPLTSTGGVPDFSRDLVNNTSGNHKNTARWRVSLNTASFGNNFDYTGTTDADPENIPVLALETRFVTAAHLRNAPVAPTRCETLSNVNVKKGELCEGLWGDGDAYVPNLVSTSDDEHTMQMRPNLYNVSRTYVYMNRQFTDRTANDWPAQRIPKPEQFQFIAHPYYTPYIDVKQLHRYNRHQVGISGGSNGTNGYDRATGPSWSGNQVSVDVNWYFNLFSNGIMRSNAIYNSITGYSNYYYSLGGEMGSDGNNAYFDVNRQPWTETDDGGISTLRNDNGTINDITNDSRVISSVGNGTNLRWRQRAVLGEMFPDSEFTFWKANGNLPNHDYNNALHNEAPGDTPAPALRYFRNNQSNAGDTFRSDTGTRIRRLANQGSPSFLNGSSDPVSCPNCGFNHNSTGDAEARLTSGAGQYVVNAFNLNLSDTLLANRPFVLSGGGGAGGYNSTEFQNIRNRLRYINTTTGVLSSVADANNIYYDHADNVTYVSSAMVRASRPDPANTNNDLDGVTGYFLINGLRNATLTGVMGMARFTQAASLQTYMDAGDRSIPGSLPGRSVQIPRVMITRPQAANIQDNPTNITVEYDVDWKRWDGNKYSPAYPDNWYDSVPLVFNVKYSRDNKRSWIYADDHSAVPAEYIQKFSAAHSTGTPIVMTGSSLSDTFNFSASSLPAGNYVLRIECHRVGYTEVGYSYHDVFLTIAR